MKDFVDGVMEEVEEYNSIYKDTFADAGWYEILCSLYTLSHDHDTRNPLKQKSVDFV